MKWSWWNSDVRKRGKTKKHLVSIYSSLTRLTNICKLDSDPLSDAAPHSLILFFPIWTCFIIIQQICGRRKWKYCDLWLKEAKGSHLKTWGHECWYNENTNMGNLYKPLIKRLQLWQNYISWPPVFLLCRELYSRHCEVDRMNNNKKKPQKTWRINRDSFQLRFQLSLR